MNQFLKRFLGFSLGPVLGAVLSFIQIPIFTYFLTTAEYGQAGLFNTLIAVIPTYIYIGMDQAFTREYQRARDKRQLLQQAAFLPMMIGLILLIIAIIWDQSISQWLFGSPDFQLAIWIGGIWVLSTVLERFFLLSIRMEEKAVEFSSFSLLMKISSFSVSIGLILLGYRDFRAIVYGTMLGQLLGDVVLYWKYRQLLDIRDFSIDPILLKRMLQFGLPVMIAVSLTGSLSSIDNLFLKQYHSLSDLGIYTLSVKIMSIIGIIKTAFTSFWVPTAYRWYEEKKELRYFQYISDSVLFVLTGIFFGLLLFKSVVVLFVGESYRDVQYILGLMAFPQIMYTLSETTNLGIVFSRKTYLNIIVSIATFIPSIMFNVLLTPTLSYKGAAIASFSAYIMFYFARTYLSHRSGFTLSHSKQTVSIILMAVAALLNAFDIQYIELITLAIGLVALYVQWGTVQKTLEIKRSPNEWDFT